MVKTNVMRLLETARISYRTSEYEYDENNLSGLDAAEKIGFPPEQVFNTLVTWNFSFLHPREYGARFKKGCYRLEK